MKKENEAKERVRKEYQHGKTTQKMMTFRCDNDNLEWLQSKPNKGRYINELIARDRIASRTTR